MASINLEYTAEDLISHILQRNGILISKPKFDIKGADLIAFKEFNDSTKIGRIQCKGRTLKVGKQKSTSIKIPVEYVTGAFFLFLYVDTGVDNTVVYYFNVDDIRKWKKTKDEKMYTLTLYAKHISNTTLTTLTDKIFSDEKIPEISKIIVTTKSRLEILFRDVIDKNKEIKIKEVEIKDVSHLLNKLEKCENEKKQVDIFFEAHKDAFEILAKPITKKILVKHKKSILESLEEKKTITQIYNQIQKSNKNIWGKISRTDFQKVSIAMILYEDMVK